MQKIGFREVVFRDCDFILCIRNSVGARRFAQDTSLISAEIHRSWFSTRLNNVDEEPFWVVTIENFDIGYVRFDKKSEKNFVLSIAIAEEFRGKNFGKAALLDSVNAFHNRYPNVDINAVIHSGNLASLRIFLECGFVEQDRVGDFIDFKLRYEVRK